MQVKTIQRLKPFILTLLILFLDQLSKWVVSVTIRPWSVGFSLFGDFFRIIRVYNPGIAFSIGGTLSSNIRTAVFGVFPLIVICVVIFINFRSNDFTRFQRWCVAGIVGGGLGNLIDRFFRPEGVLDFLSFKFYGLFGFDRWPTFNFADASVVICGIILIFSILVSLRNTKGNSDEQEN